MLLSKGLRTGNFAISSDKMNGKRKIDKFSNITYCIHGGKREATDGSHVDSKGTGITQQ